MNESDPLDDLLRHAFETDRARAPTIDVVHRVMKRIRLRQRLRALVLLIAAVTGLAALVVWVPAPGSLLEALPNGVSLPEEWQGDGLMLALLAMAGAVWLVMMDEELV